MLSIPLVDLAAQFRDIADEVRAGIDAVMAEAAFIGGPQVAAFEGDYAAFVGVRHCIGVGNGTDALEIALRAVGVGPDSDVIVPANTFIATAEAVVRAGGRPVFVDVDPDTLLLDPSGLERALTPSTKAVVPVSLFGQVAQMERVAEVVADRRIAIVEDGAQSQGAERIGQRSGSFGHMAATSFYPGKNLGAAGDAGAVTTDDDDLARAARLMGAHGSERRYDHEVFGFNSRLDTVQAVVLNAKLRRLKDWNERRREAATRYEALLRDLPRLRLPVTAEGNQHVWHLYVVRVPHRDKVLAALHRAGIGAAIHYPVPLHLTGAFRAMDVREGAFPVAERAAQDMLTLPLHPHLTAAQQERVADVVASALG